MKKYQDCKSQTRKREESRPMLNPRPLQVALFLLLCCAWVTADSIVIDDVNVNLKGVPTDIGDITVSVPGASDIMEVEFNIDPAWKNLCNWVEFHWFQIAVRDDCPLESAVTGMLTATPYVDPPSGGYLNPGNAFDMLPWYDEVAGGDWCKCQPCATFDTKTPCSTCVGGAAAGSPCSKNAGCPGGGACTGGVHPGPWDIRFRTWLVAHTPGTMEFCLIAGFEWARTDAAAGGTVGPINLGAPGAAHLAEARAALVNADSGFAGWTVNAKCDVENCFVECKDGTSVATFGKTGEACNTQCVNFCGTEDEVKACFLKGEFIKGNIPTVSAWGMVALTLLVLAAGTIVVRRRQRMAGAIRN